MAKKEEKKPFSVTLNSADLAKSMAKMRLEEEEKQKTLKLGFESWKSARAKMVKEYFICPVCGNTEYLETKQYAGTATSTGGFICEYDVYKYGGSVYTRCTVKFDNPSTFTTKREELKPLLAEHDQSRPEEPVDRNRPY